MATATRREFTKTLACKTRTGKIDIRDRVLTLFESVYSKFNSNRQFKMVTLSSMQWLFEKKLIEHLFTNYKDANKRGITLKSFEYDYKLFCIAAMNIPSGKFSKIIQDISSMNYQVVQSNVSRHLVSVNHIDVFDYLKSTDNQFDFLWLDLTSPVDFIADKLHHIPLKMHDESCLILSFSKGRERTKIVDRIQYVKDILCPELTYIETIEYVDTVAMMNMVFRKTNPQNVI